MRRDRQGGFTLLEIMVSMVVLVVGMLGVIALDMTTVKGNRVSRMLDRCVEVVAEEMEDLRGMTTSTIIGLPGTTCTTGTCTNTTYYADITTSDGVVYHRSFSVVDLTNQVTLKLVTATVSYADDQDSTITHSQTMQMIRTTLEGL